MGMGGMMGGMGGMEDMADAMGGGMDMGMGGGGMDGMMGADFEPDPEQVFRQGLQRAIRALSKARNDEQRDILKGYVKKALEERYARMINSRRQELDRLKAQISKLEQDLVRRESAAKRVIEVQMQSVELASEGLLEFGELRSPGMGPGIAPGMNGGAGMGMGSEMESSR